MKELLLFDLKNCFSNTKFKAVSILILLIPIIGFVINCNFYYGLDGMFIRSVHDQSFLNSLHMLSIKNWFIVIMPLLMLLLCSDIYSREYSSGVYKNIITKKSRSKYFFSKIIAISILTFTVVFFSLAFNYLLCYITYPLNAFDSPSALPDFAITEEYRSYGLFDMLRIQHKYIYDFVFILLFSIISVFYSLIGFVVSLFIKDQKISIIGTFLGFIFTSLLLTSLFGSGYDINYYLQGYSKGTYILIIWILFFLLFIVGGTILKIKIYDEI